MNAIGTVKGKHITRRARNGSDQHRLRRTVRTAAQLVIGLALFVLPWLLGGVLAAAYVWLFVAALVALFLCGLLQLGRHVTPTPVPVAVLPLALALLLGLFQLAPLPVSILGGLAPRNVQLWQELTAADQVQPTGSDLALDVGIVQPQGTPRVSLHPAATRHDLSMLALASGIFLLGVGLFGSQKEPLWLLGGLAVLGLAMAFFGIAQQLVGSDKIFGTIAVPEGAHPFAAFVNRNNAGGFLNICLAAALGLTVWAFSRRSAKAGSEMAARLLSNPIARESRWARWVLRRMALIASLFADFNVVNLLGLTALTFISAGVICSLSRGAWLSAAGGGAVVVAAMLFKRRTWTGPLLLVPAVLVGYLLVAWLGQEDAIQSRAATLDRQQLAQNEVRLSHWQDAAGAGRAFPLLGSGLGTYRYVYKLYEEHPQQAWFYHADNSYLEAFVETGIVGLSLMLLAVLLVALASYRLLREPTHSTSYACGLAGLFALTSQAIHGFFDFGLYVPANMAAFALVCGMVTGRAARCTYDQDRRRSQLTRRLRALLISMPRARALAPVSVALLAIAVLWGLGQARAALRLESAFRSARIPDTREEADLSAVQQRLVTVSAALARCPDDGEAQRRMAKLWIHRYRLQAFDLLRNDQYLSQAQDEDLWAGTAPLQLHALAHQLDRQRRWVELDELRRSRSVQTSLATAVRHLLQARQACPLLGDVHLLLAELAPVVGDSATDQQHLERVRQVAHGDAELMAECGLAELQAGRMDQALADWRRASELDAKRFPRLLNIVMGDAELRSRAKELFLPADIELLMATAVDLGAGQPAAPVRDLLLDTAEGLVVAQHESKKIANDERHYLLGRICALRQETEKSIEHLVMAVELRPREIEWRYELAQQYKASGQYDEAFKQATWCYRVQPDDRRYETLFTELVELRLTPKRET